jgi:hypothetical protein
MDPLEQASLYGYCTTCGAVRSVRRTLDTPQHTRLDLVCPLGHQQ